MLTILRDLIYEELAYQLPKDKLGVSLHLTKVVRLRADVYVGIGIMLASSIRKHGERSDMAAFPPPYIKVVLLPDRIMIYGLSKGGIILKRNSVEYCHQNPIQATLDIVMRILQDLKWQI